MRYPPILSAAAIPLQAACLIESLVYLHQPVTHLATQNTWVSTEMPLHLASYCFAEPKIDDSVHCHFAKPKASDVAPGKTAIQTSTMVISHHPISQKYFDLMWPTVRLRTSANVVTQLISSNSCQAELIRKHYCLISCLCFIFARWGSHFY